MADVKKASPHILTLEYCQDKSDPDYGTCLFARFYFDLDNYTMTIESDCGTYGYGWVPTHKTESFLHLMARCEGGYILDKIASRSIINEDATYNNVIEVLKDYGIEGDSVPDTFWDDIKVGCSYDSAGEIVGSILGTLNDFDLGVPEDSYDLYSCIEYEFPARARKICEVFEKHIRPAIAKEIVEQKKPKPCPVDRGKLLIGLECHRDIDKDRCGDCTYYSSDIAMCAEILAEDALAYIGWLEERVDQLEQGVTGDE